MIHESPLKEWITSMPNLPQPINPQPSVNPDYEGPEGFAKAEAETRRPRTLPVPNPSADLIKAFGAALLAYRPLAWGEPDRKLRLDGVELTIGEIADRAALLPSRMPDHVCKLLFEVAPRHLLVEYLEPEGATFEAGGKLLRAMYDKVLTKRRTMRA
jgi:hypothetical protein